MRPAATRAKGVEMGSTTRKIPGENHVCDTGRDKKPEEQNKLTLPIGGHVRHGGSLHHSCRTSTRTTWHHGTWIGSTRKRTTSPHGVLLVIHHLLLLLARTRTRLHLGVLTWWGAIVWLSCRIAVAIGSRVHGSTCLIKHQAGNSPKRSKGGLEGAPKGAGDQPDWDMCVCVWLRKHANSDGTAVESRSRGVPRS